MIFRKTLDTSDIINRFNEHNHEDLSPKNMYKYLSYEF